MLWQDVLSDLGQGEAKKVPHITGRHSMLDTVGNQRVKEVSYCNFH